MPKRTRSHELEDLSRNRLHRIFEGIGWTVEDIAKDYGEDLLVRIFEHGSATPLKFFVQAKATDNIARYLKKGRDIFNLPVDNEHLDQWNGFHEPVFLTIWDSRSDNTYWVCIQDAMAKRDSAVDSRNRSTTRISISLHDRLNDDGIRRLHAITRARNSRLMREQEGARVLIDFLESESGIKVNYSPEQGVVIFRRPGKGEEVVLFGKVANQLLGLATKLNKSPKQALLTGIRLLRRLFDEHARSGEFPMVNKSTGKIEKRKMTTNQLRHYMLAQLECFDEETEE